MKQTIGMRIGRSALVTVLAGGVALAGVAPAANAASAAPAAQKMTIGPFGYGSVKLGMSAARAKATGKIVRKTINAPTTCSAWDLKAQRYGGDRAGLFISRKRGVVTISAPGNVKTPQGIGRGSTPAQLKAAYPNLKQNALYGTFAAVPGNPKASYVFLASKNMVVGVILILNAQDCLK
ncbi:hypothetical protein FHR32_007523 [Streptosporangium album]|uniref:Uncharacterized protein n=1 Tax=Streptosporangium album TaxID=47479 RepID=A0A7W7WDR8_9ACTN|nr:hypothetical protein [Streptosporangium album]MBB4943123.1 hypothetical protein [Streptosporangium album]